MILTGCGLLWLRQCHYGSRFEKRKLLIPPPKYTQVGHKLRFFCVISTSRRNLLLRVEKSPAKTAKSQIIQRKFGNKLGGFFGVNQVGFYTVAVPSLLIFIYWIIFLLID